MLRALAAPALALALQAQSPDERMASLEKAHVAFRDGDWGKDPARQAAIRKSDQRDRAKAWELLAQDQLKDPRSYDQASLIFQHGDTADDHLVARELDLLACFKGVVYMPMPAMAEDGALMIVRGRQRFGCGHLFTGPESGKLMPMEPDTETSVTDALRMDVMVPVLALSMAHDAKGAAEMGFPAGKERVFSRMKPDPQGPDWIVDPARGCAKLSTLPSRELTDDQKGKVRAQVLGLYHADRFFIPADYHRAATLLLASAKGPDDFLLANELAMVAVMRMHAPAWSTFTRSWDRFAKAIGQPTRYGTTGDPVASTVAPAVARAIKEAEAKGALSPGP